MEQVEREMERGHACRAAITSCALTHSEEIASRCRRTRCSFPPNRCHTSTGSAEFRAGDMRVEADAARGRENIENAPHVRLAALEGAFVPSSGASCFMSSDSDNDSCAKFCARAQARGLDSDVRAARGTDWAIRDADTGWLARTSTCSAEIDPRARVVCADGKDKAWSPSCSPDRSV